MKKHVYGRKPKTIDQLAQFTEDYFELGLGDIGIVNAIMGSSSDGGYLSRLKVKHFYNILQSTVHY